MSTYAIGDVQGCFAQLQLLLKKIKFNPAQDTLWFVGDLVNRGPDSLAVLDFCLSLPKPPVITLGNHDLHALAVLTQAQPSKHSDTLDALINAPNKTQIINFLRQQKLLHDDPKLGWIMTHAGIPAHWDLNQAKSYAQEVETVLQSDHYLDLLKNLYGNWPNYWDNQLTGHDRLRAIINYLTRMRFCDQNNNLELTEKSATSHQYYPWFTLPRPTPLNRQLVFGHWAALQGQTNLPNVVAIDTGCVWGGALTALRLDDGVRFTTD